MLESDFFFTYANCWRLFSRKEYLHILLFFTDSTVQQNTKLTGKKAKYLTSTRSRNIEGLTEFFL